MEIHTYRSVWDAVADSPEEAANLKLRSQVMDAIKAYIGHEGITQEEAARRATVARERTGPRPDQQIHPRQAGEHGRPGGYDDPDHHQETPPSRSPCPNPVKGEGTSPLTFPPKGRPGEPFGITDSSCRVAPRPGLGPHGPCTAARNPGAGGWIDSRRCKRISMAVRSGSPSPAGPRHLRVVVCAVPGRPRWNDGHGRPFRRRTAALSAHRETLALMT